MKIDPHCVWTDLQSIKNRSPLIHNVTNYVVMQQTANSLLAIGASPVMAHAVEEVADMAMMASGLVLNIGTLSPLWIEGMRRALKAANRKQIPVVLDPVGAGATAYRTETALALLNHGTVTAIRANPSEVAALCGHQGKTRGVDSLLDALECTGQADALASREKCVVWMSGERDIITDGAVHVCIGNGDPLMGKVTGMGCTATAITGAFLTVNPDPFIGCVHAAALMGIAGEMAAQKANGPGSFIPAWMDTLYTISSADIEERLRVKTV
jgi:hydroxyethylthiazole kinase